MFWNKKKTASGKKPVKMEVYLYGGLVETLEATFATIDNHGNLKLHNEVGELVATFATNKWEYYIVL